MSLILVTGGIHDGPYTVALLREPAGITPKPLHFLAERFHALYPHDEAEQFADWLVKRHGYKRVAYTEAWLPPAEYRTGENAYAFEQEERT